MIYFLKFFCKKNPDIFYCLYINTHKSNLAFSVVMAEEDDIKFMRRCLELASKAEGLTYPNPLVGSVIVHDGRIVGEGYHLKAGGAHAEVTAINSVTDKSKFKNSQLFM